MLWLLWFLDTRGGSSPQRVCFIRRHGRQAAAHHFKEPAGPVWLDDVSCSGREASFLQCSRRQWGAHDCSHWEDVALACYPGGEGHRLSLGEDRPALRVPEWVAPGGCACPPAVGSLSRPALVACLPHALIVSNSHSEKHNLLSLLTNVIKFVLLK